MAYKNKLLNSIHSTGRKTGKDDGLTKGNEREKALLHPFFVSAVKNIYNTENEGWERTHITGRSVSSNEKQED